MELMGLFKKINPLKTKTYGGGHSDAQMTESERKHKREARDAKSTMISCKKCVVKGGEYMACGKHTKLMRIIAKGF